MMQLVVAVAVVVGSVGVGLVLQRRRSVAAPTQPRAAVPVQVDRADFAPGSPWAVIVFSSASCHTCADVVRKAQVLQSADVAVVDVEFGSSRALHAKYDIQAVPIVVVADAEGVVHAGFAGPVTATDLWAAVAEARTPGSLPADRSCAPD
ncbi:MAG: hypothetical protein RJB61_515 [Actinomycetota bacterium]|jgi:hypothetical protein